MKVLEYNELGGKTLEDAYSGWLELFRVVAEAPNGTVQFPLPPAGWVPLLWYLGLRYDDVAAEWPVNERWTRSQVEQACAAEPVLVDALWKADMQWSGERRHTWENEFPIATYSGFWRPEIRQYLNDLRSHSPTHRNCVLVPCAADKPYPAPLHSAVRSTIGPNWEIIVVTGALGLVPERMWPKAPNYDAGLPNESRVIEYVGRYFCDWHVGHYSKIVVYSDYNAWAIRMGLSAAQCLAQIDYLFGVERRYDYLDLLAPGHLERLGNACK